MHFTVRPGGLYGLRAAPLHKSRCRSLRSSRKQPGSIQAAAQSGEKSFIAKWAEDAGLKTNVTLEDFTGDR
jgi:hypothetical protein